jgi:hypothetical protein
MVRPATQSEPACRRRWSDSHPCTNIATGPNHRGERRNAGRGVIQTVKGILGAVGFALVLTVAFGVVIYAAFTGIAFFRAIFA